MLDLSRFEGTKQAFIAAVQSGALTIETKQRLPIFEPKRRNHWPLQYISRNGSQK